MSFRLRVTLLAAGAVAVAVVGAAVLMYLVLQTQLLTQVDKTLADAAVTAQAQGPRGSDRGGRPPFGDPSQTVSGRGDVFAQSIDASGHVIRADYSQPVAALVTPAAKDVAATQQQAGTKLDTTIGGTHYHVLVVPLGGATALELAYAMTDIDAVLAGGRDTAR